MLNKTVTTALILLLTLSMFVVIINIPAVKANPSSTVRLYPLSALWTTSEKKVGSYSAQLGLGEVVRVSYGQALNTIYFGTDLANVTFWLKRSTDNENSIFSTLIVDMYGNGTKSLRLVSTGMNNDTGTGPGYKNQDTVWRQYWPLDDYQAWVGVYPAGAWAESGAYHPISYWLTHIANFDATDTVLYIDAEVTVATVYVDDFIIAGITCSLEPSITLNPARGSSGTTVEVDANAGSFTAHETVRTYFGATLVNTTTTDSNGALNATFAVSSASPGTYDVTAIGLTSHVSYIATFTVPTLSITLSPTWGLPGTTVTVTGEGFTILGLVKIYFDGTYRTSDSANTYGNMSTYFTVPTTTLPGAHTVKANDFSTGNNATKPFTVPAPTITLDHYWGYPGQAIAVSGGNFTKTGTVNIYFGTTLVATTTASSGAISKSFDVPTVSPGPYTVRAFDVATTYNATATFTVGPTIWIIPSSGPPGKNVTVTGSGLTVNKTVQIWFDTTLVKTVNANSTGEINTWFLVPDATAGTHSVKAYDVYTTTWTSARTFTISTPSITLSLTFGPVYTNVTVTGSNFKINGTVNIYFGGTSVKNTTADGTGAISTFFYVPDVLPGIYTVNATDGINYDTATFHITGAGGTTTITQMLTEIEYKLDTLNITLTVDLTPVLNAIAEIEAKLDNPTYGLQAIKTAIDGISVSVDLTPVLNATAEIEAKLDVGGTFYTFVNTWFTTIGTKLDAIKAKTDLINWADITTIKSDVSAIKSAVGAPLPPIEGTVTCPTGGTVQVCNVTKAMTGGNPFKVYFTIDAQALDTIDQIYVNVYIKTTATSSLILARQINIVGITGLYPNEVNIDSIVNAEQVVVNLAWRAGITSDDPINCQVVISSP
jgi:hypothetical protein